MTDERKNYDDHANDPYNIAPIPYSSDDSSPPVDNPAEGGNGSVGEQNEEQQSAASDVSTFSDADTVPYPPAFSSSNTNPYPPAFNSSDTNPYPPFANTSPFVPPGSVPPPIPQLPRKKHELHLSLKNLLILALVVLLVLGGGTGLFLYLTRSTPGKTLEAFCSAAVKNDSGAAYQQFSPSLQRLLPEKSFASTLARDRITQCTYGTADEAQTSVQTALNLQHGSRGVNNDQVTLSKDAQGIWRISDITVARPTNVPHKAVVHHLTLSTKQTFSKVEMLFAPNGGDMGAGLAVTAGTRIVLFATGKMNVAPNNEQVEANGTSCPTKVLPEARLNCYAIVYSPGSINQVGLTGEQADFTLHTDGVFFFGINAPDSSQASGSFHLTVLTIPDKTATGLWKQPEKNGFLFSQVGGDVTLTANIYAQNYDDHISSVQFYQIGNGGSRTKICETPYDRTSTIVNCGWNMRLEGKPITNGPIKIGFSLMTDDGNLDDPDGAISGMARYIVSQRSSNYSGYAARSVEQPQPTHYQSVTARWKVPSVHCGAGEDSLVAIWPGLQGNSSKSQIAQLGTMGGCVGGDPGYAAWWEMYPAPPHEIDNSVLPGDEMVATVTYEKGKFHLTMENKSAGWHFSTVQSGTDNDTLEADCVVEAPFSVEDNQVMRLSNFGSVGVNCLANNQPVGVTGPQNMVFQMLGSQHQATTSELDQQGANFTVKWGG